MDAAIDYIKNLKVPQLKSILRTQGQLRGHILDKNIIPLNGQDQDPQELIGQRVKSFQLFARRYAFPGRIRIILDFRTMQEEEWEEDETTKKPAPIVEAVTGIRRNWQDESTCVVLTLRCEGMSKMEFFNCGSTQCTGFMDPYPSYGDLWLADDEEGALAEALLIEGP
ncbi:MAG: hypothetical protein ASARMPRED_006096 [Alectoria sarmentosa]|nr:MAG: hypothetical protein ASARMPRED_006096 [Alectoria sarmentosa]